MGSSCIWRSSEDCDCGRGGGEGNSGGDDDDSVVMNPFRSSSVGRVAKSGKVSGKI